MTTTNDLDRSIERWLEADGPRDLPPGIIEAATTEARRHRQRRGLSLRFAGSPPWPIEHRTPAWARRTLLMAAAVLVLLTLAATVLLIGARLLPPSPAPLLGKFLPAPAMLTPRFQPQATLLLDGSILVAGASIAGEIVSAELYDAASGTFEPVGSMDVGEARGRVVTQVRLADGRVLVLGSTGGQSDGRWPHTEFARIYDPASRSFTRTTPFPDDAVDASGYFVNSGGYVGTLLGDGRVRFERADPFSPVVIYDPASASYSVEDQPEAGPAFNGEAEELRLIDGRVLLMDVPPHADPSIAVYDARTGISKVLDVPDGVAGVSAQAVPLPDGRVLLSGARSAFFDPKTDSFELLDVWAPTFRLRLSDGRWLFTSPESLPLGATPRDRLSFYDPDTDTFSASDELVPRGCCWEWIERADGSVLGLAGLGSGDEIPSPATWLVR